MSIFYERVDREEGAHVTYIVHVHAHGLGAGVAAAVHLTRAAHCDAGSAGDILRANIAKHVCDQAMGERVSTNYLNDSREFCEGCVPPLPAILYICSRPPPPPSPPLLLYRERTHLCHSPKPLE